MFLELKFIFLTKFIFGVSDVIWLTGRVFEDCTKFNIDITNIPYSSIVFCYVILLFNFFSFHIF